mmetsp:Transcript_21512/g.68597  ORF Transcript_21512/g.68597 Transcript_21512/m.68597 type:complete len:321 (+) Transcript_21512:1323-2285(+)
MLARPADALSFAKVLLILTDRVGLRLPLAIPLALPLAFPFALLLALELEPPLAFLPGVVSFARGDVAELLARRVRVAGPSSMAAVERVLRAGVEGELWPGSAPQGEVPGWAAPFAAGPLAAAPTPPESTSAAGQSSEMSKKGSNDSDALLHLLQTICEQSMPPKARCIGQWQSFCTERRSERRLRAYAVCALFTTKLKNSCASCCMYPASNGESCQVQYRKWLRTNGRLALGPQYMSLMSISSSHAMQPSGTFNGEFSGWARALSAAWVAGRSLSAPSPPGAASTPPGAASSLESRVPLLSTASAAAGRPSLEPLVAARS